MSPNKSCEKFRDELLDFKKASKELETHVKECPECREILASANLVRTHGSFFSQQKHPVLKKKILQDFDHFFAQPSLASQGLSFKWMIGGLAFVACLLLLVFQLPRTPPGGLKEPFYQYSREGKTLDVPLRQPVEILQGTASVVAPDGSRFDVQGKTVLHVLERGFDLTFGTLKATVRPSGIPFKGLTPHGEIEVLGTIFTCGVSENDSSVQVISGKVRVTPTGKASQTLVDGQSMSMVYFSRPKRLSPATSTGIIGSGSLHPNED